MVNKDKTILTRIKANLKDNHPVVFTYLDGEGAPCSKSYTELITDAKKIASFLTTNYEPQSRILLIYPPGLDFISAILGCFYAGMIAVPAYPLQNPRHAYRLLSIIDSCAPQLILGSKRVVEDLSKIESLSLSSKMITEEILTNQEAHSFEVNITPKMIAFLQYTSGSTGIPKGVMITHANLVHNLATISQGCDMGKNKPSVIWLPFQHDLGLIVGVLSSIYNHNDLILLSPVSVIQRPFKWLKALSDYKAYFTAGPNFSYQLCASKVSDEELNELDLSSVRYALVAAEPNRYQTMDKFLTRFSACGFEPEAYCVGYGLAEGTLHLTTNTPHQPSHFIDVSKAALEKGLIESPRSSQDTQRIMSAGTLHPEHELVIVHPEKLTRCTENEVGEIWEHSKSVAQGYWNNKNATEATFHAQIKGEKKKYLRTGDLGFIRGDQLYTTGRQKDLLIIDGRNIYPQDLEDCVDLAHEYIKPSCTAAFSVDTGTREALVICAEIQRTAVKKDLSKVIPALRHAIASQFEIAVDKIKLLKPGYSFKTTSGKIKRTATKNAYLKDELVCFTSELTPAKNQKNSWYHPVHEVLCEVLALKKITRDQRFTELGGTSLHAKLLHHKLQEMTGFNLSPTIAFDYPTLGELTEFLENTCNRIETSKPKVAKPSKADKIAIIGISCRLPGNIRNLDDLWSLLSEGRDAIGTLPAWRWDIGRYEEETQKRINQAGILEDIDLFDAPFFNISPKEAKMMDPQHRILLETVWHALEDAGIAPDTLKKQLIGVYIGSTGADYKNVIAKMDNDDNINPYFVLDTASSVLAGRVAYFLGTQGPAETIDTACSSSLVALSEACASLLSGQTSMAIAGGVNVILYPENSIGLVRANMLSPTNRCRTFSDDADGYVRGEGCGVVILKRLSEALKDNDQIHAVIDGFAINQDGASSGLTVPNLTAQRDLIDAALSKAQLTSDSVDYIEAHGSATELGDPIEVGAINEVFGNKERPRALYLGSIKPNIGHLEAAAGIGGLLKVIVSLKKQEIPRNIHLKALNPKLDCDVTPIEIVSKNTKWHRFGKPRCAGVSSFGFSGTNAHVILEEAPSCLARENLEELPQEKLFVLSAKKIESLERLILAYADYLENTSDELADICYTTSVGRMHFNCRIALIVKDKQDLLKQLKSKSIGIKELALDEERVTSDDVVALKDAYLSGKSVDFKTHYNPYIKYLRKVSLPGYCFDKKSHWIKNRAPQVLSARDKHFNHPFLGFHFDSPMINVTLFESQLSLVSTPILSDHVFYEMPIFAFASYLSTLIEAYSLQGEYQRIQLDELNIEAPLFFKPGQTVLLQTSFKMEHEVTIATISSRLSKEGAPWQKHISGKIFAISEEQQPPINIEQLKNKATSKMNATELYAKALASDIYLGKEFQWLDECFIGPNYVLAKLKEKNKFPNNDMIRHPGLLDSGFVLGALKCLQSDVMNVSIPILIDKLTVALHKDCDYVYVQLTNNSAELHECSIVWCDAEGNVADAIEKIQFRRATKNSLLKSYSEEKGDHNLIYQNTWQEVDLKPEVTAKKSMVFGFGERSLIENCDKFVKLSLGTEVLYQVIIDELSNESWQIILDYSELYSEKIDWLIVEPLLLLTQAIVKANKTKSVTLSVITSAGYLFDKNVIKPYYAGIQGLINTIHAEYPSLFLRHIDLEHDSSQLKSSLQSGDHHLLHVWHQNRPYNLQLEKIIENDGNQPAPFQIKKAGRYLITGGLGALGLNVCEYLASKEVAEIHLLSRNSPSDEQKNIIDNIKNQYGVVIVTHQIDVIEQSKLIQLINDQFKSELSLSGIFHLAGVLDDALLPEQSMTSINNCCRVKVEGAINLSKALEDRDIPIVYFSSIASVFGNSGQANYSIANAYLDSLAVNAKTSTLSINWGPWKEAGMARDLAAKMDLLGIVGFDKEQGLKLLDDALNQNLSQLIIVDIKWPKFVASRVNNPYYIKVNQSEMPEKGVLIELLTGIEISQRPKIIQDALEKELRLVLHLQNHEKTKHSEGFFNLGMDSIMAGEFRNKIQLLVGSHYPINVADIFNYPSLTKLTQFIAEKVGIDSIKAKKDKMSMVAVNNDEPVAIVGMSCRLPGGANSPEQFFEKLLQAYDGICDVPKERWDVNAYQATITDEPGKLVPTNGGFLQWDISGYDSDFFQMSPKQSKMIDPQQRMLLENSWEALEDAAIDPLSLKESQTGVYVGIWHSDYADLIAKNYGTAGINAYTNFTTLSSAAGMISYFLGTMGPSYSVDTACSSSLVALDGAVKALRRGEINLGIVAGANLLLNPDVSIGFDIAGMLSPDGHCKTFDESANGYVRSEGIGVVIVKRLSDAIKDNDTIHALIKGIRVNHNGPASGITVPSGVAQAQLLQNVLTDSKLSAEQVGYIEAHGTGTQLGDPIEISAINRVYKNSHTIKNPLYIGSAKSNIGHLEAAAGVAGLIKAVLCIKHKKIVPNRHFKTLNKKISLAEIPARIPTEVIDWQSPSNQLIAGISSFGATGINAHVIIEQPPLKRERDNSVPLPEEKLFVLSAKNNTSLMKLINAYIKYLGQTKESLADICYTASIGRAQFNHRIAIIIKDTQDLVKQLRSKSLVIKEVAVEDDLVVSNDLTELKHAYLSGKSIDFNAYYTPYARALRKISLPGYCFDRNRYWITIINEKQESSDFVSNPLIYIENYQKYHFGHEITPSVNERILVYGNHEKVLKNSLYQPITEAMDESFEQSVVIYLDDGDFEKLIHFTKKMGHASPKAFILITSHTFDISGQVKAESRRLLGFFKCLQKEWAHVSCYFLDLNSLADAESMVSYLLHHKCDEPVIIKTDKIYVPRLSFATSINNIPEENLYKSKGCYLIIGGTGGLGLSLIEHLVSKGVKHLLITSRHEVDESLARVFDEYNKKDVLIEHFQIDASDEKNLSELFESMMDKKIVIHGVFLLAGVIKDGLLDTLSIKDYEQVSLPKIKAAKILANLVKKNPVDFLVFFSSATSIIGNPGQTNYGAANGYLDGLAYELNEQGQYTLSINWGSFLGSGMAKHLNENFAKRGIIPIDAKKGYIAMDKVLANKLTQAAILDMDWNLLKQNSDPYLEEFYPKEIESGEDWLDLIAGRSEQEQSGLVLEKIKQLVGNSLGISPEEELDVNKLFSAYGMDSIIAINLKNKLVEVMGDKVIFSNSIAFDYPSINTLHQYIAQSLINSNLAGYSKASNENSLEPSFVSEITLPIATEVLQHELFINRKINSINEWDNFLISNDNVEYKATKLQKNLLQLYRNNPDKLPYHVLSVKRIVTSIDFQKLAQAINLVVAENPCFRMSMREDKTYGLIFKTTKDLTLDINFIENDNVPQALMEILNQEIDLAEKSLIRVYVMNKNLLILKVNHMICDGLSLEMVFDKIYQYYINDINHVDLLDADYINYVANLSHNNEHYTKSYIKYLQDLSPLIKDHVSEALPGKQKGKFIHQPISSETKKSITNFCMQNNCSEYAFYLTVYSKALSHYLKDSKIYTSIVKSNRSHLPNKNLLGYFADNVPLLLELDKKKSFKEQVHYVQNRIIEFSSNFSEPLLWREYKESGYVQPDYLFNHFKTSDNNELFEEYYELTESMLSNMDEVSLWNVFEQEKISLMIRSTNFIDDFLVIYNEDEITTEEVHDLLNSMNEIIKNIVENY
ncbi:MAG: SDR family NAD(P)-dependent oxidoreductase [Legionella sp.]|nr:SDR family NAD(P)-dependent oxidoreductase [Legionella sp.]